MINHFMKKIRFTNDIIFNSKKRFLYLSQKGFYKNMDDEEFIKREYFSKEGKKLNLESPTLLNEKLQWLKLYDHNIKYTYLADKYEVKNIIGKEIGYNYIIPTIKLYNNVEEINLEELPEKFVLKCTHNSCNKLCVCKSKKDFDLKKAKKDLNKQLKQNYFYNNREWPYKNIKPRIIAEEYISNKDSSPLVDYKFYCFGGKPIYFMVSYGEAEHNVRNHKFNMELDSIDYLFKKKPAIPQNEIIIPSNFLEMKTIVEKLCKGYEHVRIDLYNVDGKIYFGECTFYTGAGYINLESKDFANYLASLIDIRKVRNDD